MSRYTVEVESAPSAEDIARLGAGLSEHAIPTTGVPGFVPLAIFMRDESGEMVAGISGTTDWNWLHIALFWISEPLRRGGHGARLIGAIENEARSRGCTHAHLDTFSWQARPFYERHGYELFATLDDYPAGHKRFFMRKALGDAAADHS